MRELNAEWYRKNHAKALATRAVYREEHREECRQLIRAWYQSNKQRVLDSARLQRTGCTPGQYLALFQQQGGRCAICGKSSTRQLHADHCHTTKVVRGLLCGSCNTALGLFGDSPEVLRAAVRYLNRNSLVGGT